MPDTVLWERFVGGCETSFARLYERHAASLYRYGTKLTPHADQVEDGIHDLFVELWERREHLNTPATVLFYLLKALKHKIIQRCKENNRSWTMTESIAIPSQETRLIEAEWSEELRHKLASAMKTLSKRQQELVFLAFYEEMSHAEIAEVMEISYQAVSNLMYRTMKALRQAVASPRPLRRKVLYLLLLLLSFS